MTRKKCDIAPLPGGLFLRFDAQFFAIRDVGFRHFFHVALHFDRAVFQIYRLLTKRHDLAHAVRNDDESRAAAFQFVYFGGALVTEGDVADPRTSSISMRSGLTSTAIAKPSREIMPDE